MTRHLFSAALVAASIAAAAVPGLSQAAPAPVAAPWQTIEQREANLNARIDAGLRNRTLTQAEAAQLRMRLRSIEALEATYRASRGLDARERADLDARFNALSASIRTQATDDQYGGWTLPGWNGGGWVINGRWQTLEQRQSELNRRIDAGARSGAISRSEEASLRAEFNRILNLEHHYQSFGLTAAERATIDHQFDQLALRIRNEASDRNGAIGRYDQPGRTDQPGRDYQPGRSYGPGR